jgi:hypothetical protein
MKRVFSLDYHELFFLKRTGGHLSCPSAPLVEKKNRKRVTVRVLEEKKATHQTLKS